MTILAWVLIVISMAATIIAGFTLMLNRGRMRSQRFLGFFLISCAAWSIFSVLQSYSWSQGVGTMLVRSTFISALVMSYAMYCFVTVLAGRKRYALSILLLLLTVATIALSLTPQVISGIDLRAGATIPIREALYKPVIIVLIAQLLISVVTIVRYYASLQTSKVKSQTQLVMIGLIAGIIVGSLTNIILPNIAPELHTSRIAWLPAVVWMATLVYAVVRHTFLDIRLVLVRSGGFVLSAVVAIALYYAAVFAGSYWFGILSNLGPEEVMANSILIVVLAVLFRPLKLFFDNATNAVFGRANYSRSAVYARLTDRIARVDTIEALQQSVQEVVGGALQARNVDVCIIGDERYMRATLSGLTLSEQELLAEELSRSSASHLEFDPYDKLNTLTRIARRRHLSLVFPLYVRGVVAGLLCVGPLPGRLYTNFDHGLLETVADELSITIEKLLSIEQVRGFNEELKRKVEYATKQLRASNSKLLEMDATKDEFVSMASHQLRTPLTSVKGYISMVLEGDAGEITKEQRQLLEEAFTSSERMVHLIGDFLNVSRLQNGKFIIDRHECDLAKVVEQEVEVVQQIARSHDIKVVYKAPSRFPILYIDEGKIRQVIMNFIDNAIYYSPETAQIRVSLDVEDGDAVLRVIDQGMGVPKEAQKKLFGKFFRAENARKQRPDGTGIGLYLAKRVIDGHNGKPLFESMPGKGSTFGFRLPIKQMSVPPVETE